MRKVKNASNTRLLSVLNDNFIRPLISLLRASKEENCEIAKCSAFTSFDRNARKVLLASFTIKFNKNKTFEQVCNDVLDNTTLPELTNVSALYDRQTTDLTAGSYSLEKGNVPKAVKKLFVEYLYQKLFDNEIIWKALGEDRLTRQAFHYNFRKDNDFPSSCPYCDLDTINSSGTHIIEHFLPKSKYPLIALHPNNLFTACHGCNLPEAKGAKVVPQVTSPYISEVGRLVTFNFNSQKKKISLKSLPNRPEVEGFLELVKLPKRYAEENTWYQFYGRQNALIESMQGRSFFALDDLLKYVAVQQSGAPLTYALFYWVEKVYLPINVNLLTMDM